MNLAKWQLSRQNTHVGGPHASQVCPIKYSRFTGRIITGPKLTRQQQRRHQGEPDANLTAIKAILDVNKHSHI